MSLFAVGFGTEELRPGIGIEATVNAPTESHF